MNKLVIRQTYIHGIAFDTSNNRNHGVPYAVTQTAAGALAPAFEFRSPDSRVVIRPSTSLHDLIAVRAVATFYVDLAGGVMTRRYNLIEGELSFALFVNPDGSLMGTILDANGHWNGAQSAPNLVQPKRWYQAELRHDGINESLIFLDGVQVGAGYAAPGQVRSVGPNGVAVGHWPEPPGVYTMDGLSRLRAWVLQLGSPCAMEDRQDRATAPRALLVGLAQIIIIQLRKVGREGLFVPLWHPAVYSLRIRSGSPAYQDQL